MDNTPMDPEEGCTVNIDPLPDVPPKCIRISEEGAPTHLLFPDALLAALRDEFPQFTELDISASEEFIDITWATNNSGGNVHIPKKKLVPQTSRKYIHTILETVLESESISTVLEKDCVDTELHINPKEISAWVQEKPVVIRSLAAKDFSLWTRTEEVIGDTYTRLEGIFAVHFNSATPVCGQNPLLYQTSLDYLLDLGGLPDVLIELYRNPPESIILAYADYPDALEFTLPEKEHVTSRSLYWQIEVEEDMPFKGNVIFRCPSLSLVVNPQVVK